MRGILHLPLQGELARNSKEPRLALLPPLHSPSLLLPLLLAPSPPPPPPQLPAMATAKASGPTAPAGPSLHKSASDGAADSWTSRLLRCWLRRDAARCCTCGSHTVWCPTVSCGVVDLGSRDKFRSYRQAFP